MLRSLIIVALISIVPAFAENARVIGWDDLLPEVEPLDDPLEKVSMAVRFDLGFIAKVEADAERGVIDRDGPEYLAATALADRLSAQGIDVTALAAAVARRDAEIARRRAALNGDLEGQVVRIPGYALPLEQSPDGVTEFLLVPYVGACIHVPPPPANQIVHAALDAAYRLEGLFQPVWITGTITTGKVSRSLSFVDGRADVPTGYSMRVTAIEAYNE